MLFDDLRNEHADFPQHGNVLIHIPIIRYHDITYIAYLIRPIFPLVYAIISHYLKPVTDIYI